MDTEEVKKSRLLTDRELLELHPWSGGIDMGVHKLTTEEQDAKTASIKDKEREEKNSRAVTEAYFKGKEDGLFVKDTECQERVERMRPYFEDAIEVLTNAQGEWGAVTKTFSPEWSHPLKEAIELLEQALKKQEGVKDGQ